MREMLIPLAAVLGGIFLLGYDQRTDDTGVEAGLLVAISFVLALAAPRRAFAVGLGVGLPIAARGVMNRGSGGIAALAFALIGAGLGWLMRSGWPSAR